jgi:hypothetical protein
MLRTGRILILLVALAAASTSRAQIADAPQADAYPIIAELFADPGRYEGRRVMIYGLVIESDSSSTFLLQDVSQRPLKILGSERLKATVGDQLIVLGSFHSASDGPYVSAIALIPTQVVAGGGCC